MENKAKFKTGDIVVYIGDNPNCSKTPFEVGKVCWSKVCDAWCYNVESSVIMHPEDELMLYAEKKPKFSKGQEIVCVDNLFAEDLIEVGKTYKVFNATMTRVMLEGIFVPNTATYYRFRNERFDYSEASFGFKQ